MVESSLPIRTSDVAHHYDQLDRFYREVWGEYVHHGLWETGRESSDEAVQALSHLVAQRAGLRPGAEVCDVGCGYGATSRLFADEYGARVTALTISQAQKQFASQVSQVPGNPAYILEDWMRNHRPDAAFDALVAIESTEHMADKRRVFSEASRVLKSGGSLVVCAWLAGEVLKPWEVRHLVEPVCREGRLPGMGTEEDYVAWMEQAGFDVLERLDVTSKVSRTWPICAMRFVIGLMKRPGYRKFLMDAKNDNRIFALTMLRIWVAYRVGAMRYVVFSSVKRACG